MRVVTTSLDDFLAEQDKTPNLAVLERIADDADNVTLTPWTKGGGCGCSSAMKVKKSAIKSVTPTDSTHECCGKTLKVVEVEFNADANVAVQDLFQERRAAAVAAHETNLRNTRGSGVSSHAISTRGPCMEGSHLCAQGGSTWCCQNGVGCGSFPGYCGSI